VSGRYFYTHWLSDANVSKTNLLQARPGQDFTYQALSGSDTYAFTLINTFLVSYDRNAGNTGTGAPRSGFAWLRGPCTDKYGP